MKPGAVRAADHGSAHALGDRGGGGEGAARGRSPATNSTSFIRAGGLKKCIPQIRSGSRRVGGDLGHRQRRGVGGEHRGGRAGGLEPGEEPALQREILRERLDHQPARRQLIEPRDRDQACSRARGFALAPAPAIDAALEPGAQPLAAALERLRVGVVEERLEAGQAGELGDPGAHRAGAGDPDRARSRGRVGRRVLAVPELDRVAAEVDVVKALAGGAGRAAEGADLVRLRA